MESTESTESIQVMSVDEQYALITRNLKEVLGSEAEIKAILQERPLNIYWGTAPTGRIHFGYWCQLLKIADYLKAGCKVKILIADLHAYLDSMKSTLAQLELRTKYYTVMIQQMLLSLNIDISQLEFVKGTDFQLSKEYTMDVYKMNSMISVKDAIHAGAEVVKQSDNPVMTGLLYPSLQALDEHYLASDAETGGVDQRKLFVYANHFMPKLGYRKRIHFMTEMIPGLRFVKKENNDIDINGPKLNREELLELINSEPDDTQLLGKIKVVLDKHDQHVKSSIQVDKMSSSNNTSKIDMLDTKNQIKAKINKCYCLVGDVDDNCLLVMLEKLLFPLLKYKNLDFVINRKDKFGGPIIYNNFEDVRNDFKNEILHPADFKMGIIDSLDLIAAPVREAFNTKENMMLVKRAYPNN